MLHVNLLSACVGRWSESRPTLDVGSSSVLLPCLLTPTAMLAYCLFLSYIYALCVPSDVWPPWHPCLSLLVVDTPFWQAESIGIF